MALMLQLSNELGPDETGPADHDDAHGGLLLRVATYGWWVKGRVPRWPVTPACRVGGVRDAREKGWVEEDGLVIGDGP